MPAPDIEPAKSTMLRHDAETRLRTGAAPTSLGWSLGVDALSLIHKLASSPWSAPDALRLLHEVQVHQVELDLQHEQIETTQRELSEELAHYRGLYECVPLPCLTLGPRRDIVECNLSAAALAGTPREGLWGRDFEELLAPASRSTFQECLNALDPDGASARCEALLVTGDAEQKVQIVARRHAGGRISLAVVP